MGTPQINQRDLRTRSKEIMDAVEAGQSFTVTRDGRDIAELVPIRPKREFVPRADFVFGSQRAPIVDADRLRGDLDGAFDDGIRDPYVG